jgi:hypothetical protein
MTKALFLEFAHGRLAIAVKRSARARRMSLRVDPLVGGVVMVLPEWVPLAEAQRFAERQRDWIGARVAALPARVPFTAGTEVPVLGVLHRITPVPGARRGVWLEDGRLMVSGAPEHLPRRVEDFLKSRARALVAARAHDAAARIGRKVARVAVRDTRSRWGSCTAAGALAFCWRLVMAPEWVLDYVVAHEVAHLAEMNHGPEFWQVVAGLSPDAKAGRAWLKKYGADLHRYG